MFLYTVEGITQPLQSLCQIMEVDYPGTTYGRLKPSGREAPCSPIPSTSAPHMYVNVCTPAGLGKALTGSLHVLYTHAQCVNTTVCCWLVTALSIPT